MNKLATLAILLLTTTGYCEEALFGGQSMIGELQRVIVRTPDLTFGRAEPTVWNYKAEPNLAKARKEHEALIHILKKHGVEVIKHNKALPNHADSIFVQDPVIITDAGAVILQMGKFLRRGEESILKDKLIALGIPIIFQMSGSATAEAGDMLWLDDKTLAVGRGYRTNQEGLTQITEALSAYEIKVIPVDLPTLGGEEANFHLQSLVSIVDYKKALIYKKYLPVSFIEALKEKRYTLIDVPESEYPTLGANVLAIKPHLCLMIEGNPITKKRLENHGIKVLTYTGNEISIKPDAGVTYLIKPILRADIRKLLDN